jgi:hypothetical protein
LRQLGTDYDGRDGYLGEDSLYSNGWWLVYTTVRNPLARNAWVQDPRTKEVRQVNTTSYPLRGYDVEYWIVDGQNLQVEIVRRFSKLPPTLLNEVMLLRGRWVLYRDNVHELESKRSLSQRMRFPLLQKIRLWSGNGHGRWHEHKKLRMDYEDERALAYTRPYRLSAPGEMDATAVLAARAKRARQLYEQSRAVYKQLRDSATLTLANARVFRIPIDGQFDMELELECDDSLDEKILLQETMGVGTGDETFLEPDRVRVARAVRRVRVRNKHTGDPSAEWRPRTGYNDAPPGAAATRLRRSENVPRHVLYEGSIEALLKGGPDVRYAMVNRDGEGPWGSDAAFLRGDVQGGPVLTPAGRFTTADETRRTSLGQVVSAARVAARGQRAAGVRAWRPGGAIAENLKRTWGDALGGDDAEPSAAALPSLAALKL